MGVQPITPAAALVALLARMVREELGAKHCRKHGIGRLRRDLRDAPVAACQGSERILANVCAHCGKCERPLEG